MRPTINHTAPADMQGCPSDNTTEYIDEQVNTWKSADYRRGFVCLIHTQTAMEIASAWHSPGNAFAPFASTGTITDGLAEEIAENIALWERDLKRSIPVAPDTDKTRDQLDALRALNAYVRACTLPVVWSVGHNIAGYVSETDVSMFIDYADAVSAFRDMVKEAPDALSDDECSCVTGPCCGYCLGEVTQSAGTWRHVGSALRVTNIGSGDFASLAHNHDGTTVNPADVLHDGITCDFHSLDNEVRAYLADEVPWVMTPYVTRPQPHGGNPRELLIYLRPDSVPLPTAYWVNSVSGMTYGDYLASREGS